MKEAIYRCIWDLLKAENDSETADHTLSGIGTHFIVKPFMLRNGYRDGSGWWIAAVEQKRFFDSGMTD